MSIGLCMIADSGQDNLASGYARNENSGGRRKRNISILEKELERNPGCGFTLFNLGNEYFATGNFLNAVEYYEQSYVRFDPEQGYSPKLVLKLVNCYMNMKKYGFALKLVEEGLGFYPDFTELEYFRALIFFNQLKYTIAIKHFEKCIAMGESRLYLNMVEGAGTYRAKFLLGEIYFRMEDYKAAIGWYKASVSNRRDFTPALVKLYMALCRERPDNGRLEKSIGRLHRNCGLKPANVLFDVLICEKYYELALKYIARLGKETGAKAYLSYYESVCGLMLKKYKEAYAAADRAKADREYLVRAVCLQALSRALQGDISGAGILLGACSSDSEDKLLKVYGSFISLLATGDNIILSDNETESIIFSTLIFDLLKILIRLHEFSAFEKALNMLNSVNDKTVLLKLAKLYYNEGCYELACQEFKRSVKLFDVMDFEGADMLGRLKARGL